MAAAIERETGLDSKVSTAGLGAFEVKVGSQVIFSKLALGRFPDEAEVIRALEPAVVAPKQVKSAPCNTG